MGGVDRRRARVPQALERAQPMTSDAIKAVRKKRLGSLCSSLVIYSLSLATRWQTVAVLAMDSSIAGTDDLPRGGARGVDEALSLVWCHLPDSCQSPASGGRVQGRRMPIAPATREAHP